MVWPWYFDQIGLPRAFVAMSGLLSIDSMSSDGYVTTYLISPFSEEYMSESKKVVGLLSCRQ
jgi:hypothetical protein